ncbi:MAG: stage II sporulation protein R, partial [Desulfotomaculaceae bacterium]|nr:stage II sporulation protein R [Desulfotomaculaceae bacterium]
MVTLASGLGYQDAEPVYSPDSLIRLHVVSNSDSNEDQDLKRKVRDEIVA